MKYLRNNNGFIKPLLSIALLVLVIYTGFQFGIPYYRYSALKNETKETIRIGLGNVDKIRSEVLEAAERLNVPIEEKDITVIVKPKKVQVQFSWSVTVDILGLYQRTLDFTVDVED